MKPARHAPSRRRLPARLLAVLLACLALAPQAHALLPGVTKPADSSAKPAAPDPKAAPAPEVIAPADIPGRADFDERFVQDVLARTKRKDPTAQLGPRLDELTRQIVELSGTFRNDELRDLSAIRLESVESHWRFLDRELTQWRRELNQASAPYYEDAAELARRRASWEATQAALAEGSVTSALRDRAASILAQITVAEQALSAPLDNQIKLGRRANRVQASIEAGQKGVDAAIKYYDRRLVTVDVPPIWEIWGRTQFSEDEAKGAVAGLRLENYFLQQWGAANQQRLLAYKLVALALLPVMLWLAWRSKRIVGTEPEMREAAQVLLRPFSAWLVLVLLGVPFWFPDGPLILHQIALLAALVPVLRLLPRRIFEVLGPLPYIATGLYLAYRLGFLLMGQPLYHRMYLLLVTVVTAGAIAWLLVRDSRQPVPGERSRVRAAAHAVGWLAVLALLVAAVANVVGNISLAEMLSGAVLDSGYVGLALYAGAHVLTSIMRLALARRSVSRFRVITQHAGPLLGSATRLVMWIAAAAWLVVTLNEFRVARPVSDWLKRVLTFSIEAGNLSVTLGSVLLFFVSVWIAFWVAKTVRVVLQDEVLPKMQLPRGVSNSVSTLSYYALVIVGLLIALAAAGFETSQFAIVFGALGIGIGLGLQNVVNNFVSGLILMFERPIQPGDVVEVSGTSGKVREIGMRATTLTTFEGADVVVPNGTLLSEKLINWTLSDMNRRIDVNVGVAYGSDPRKVIELLASVAATTPGIATEPRPAVLFTGFGANSLDFGVRAWTNDFDDWVAIRTEMTARVYEALRTAGLEIPFPQQDLHLRTVSPQARDQLRAMAAPVAGDAAAPPAAPGAPPA
jgi:small-conductance mechanosensitive channel